MESPASSTVVNPCLKPIFWALIKAVIFSSNETSPNALSTKDIGPSIRIPVRIPFFVTIVPLFDSVFISIPEMSNAFWLTK